VLGTSLEIRWTLPRGARRWFGGLESATAEKVENAVLGEIRRLELIFSTYREDSELSRWQAAGPAARSPISAELAEVLERAALWRDRTSCAFDPSCAASTGPLWEVVRVDGGAFARKLTTRSLDFDAIAKGYIVDRAALAASAALGGPDASDLLVNIGGDIRHLGHDAVAVAVEDPLRFADNVPPLERVRLSGQGIATSGPHRRGIREARGWRSHIIDPRTGRPADGIASATVIAASAADADALATAFNVLAPDESLAIASATPGVECLLIDRDGRRFESAGWDAARTTPSRIPAPRASRGPLLTRRELIAWVATASGAVLAGAPFFRSERELSAERVRAVPWDERFELALTFQIGDPRAGLGLRRPYVATYVETADGTSVRTISLWSQKAQWIREMRRWYRAEGLRRTAAGGPSLIDTLTQPTRPPGTYTVVWDGRDDQGQLVEQGEYVIFLESVRQGSSSFVTQQAFTFASTPFQATMADYAGFSGIQLDFRERQ
jgi:thiamine biosynthesis lipoprotein